MAQGLPNRELPANGQTAAPAPAALELRITRLKRLARARRFGKWALLLVVPVLSVLLDLGRRAPRIADFDVFHAFTYTASFLESVCVWGPLLYAASRSRGWLRNVMAVLFTLMATFAIGGQTYFYQQYHAYLNVDVSVFASNFMDSVVNQLLADLGNYVQAKLPPLFLAALMVWLGRRVLRPGRRLSKVAAIAAPLLLVASFFIPTQHSSIQAATPDTLYLQSVGGLLRTQLGLTDQSHQLRPRTRQSLPLPPLTRASVPQRNVLFVILESVRADSTCTVYDASCQRTAATNRLLPQRFPLTQMRSMDSSTAISLAVLWSGLRPTEDRDTLHEWPLIFDYARSLGYDTAYWTSQNMLFGNVRLWVKNLGVGHTVTATELDPTADLDMGAPETLLADHVSQNLHELREPFLAVVQLSNVHYPYYLDPALPTPFQPWTTSKAPADNPYFKNFYQNAVHQQDLHLARMISALKATAAGERTVIVYTSDHAEAFREHGQMGHTFSIYDEEVHVPAWIEAPSDTLTDSELQSLKDKRDAFVFHVDVVPTLLDLMGVLDEPRIQKYLARLPGHSLLRPELTLEALPMTNCSGVWSCAFENWGIMQGNRKLEARSWDTAWNCFDLQQDPRERNRLPIEQCHDLLQLAERTYGRLPGKDRPKP